MTTHSPIFRALLLAGGTGSRLRPITDTVPKCLVPIEDGKPILDYWLDTLEAVNVNDVLINTHHHREIVLAHLTHVNATRSVVMHESYEATLLGSAGTLHANREWMNEADHCVIIYADNLSNIELGPLFAYHLAHGDPFTMMLFQTEKPTQCGIAEMDDDGRVVTFVEKPEHPKSNLANGGLYVVTADAYREMADANAFDIGFDILPQFVGRMRGYEIDGYHRDIGTHDALEQARRDVVTLFQQPTAQ